MTDETKPKAARVHLSAESKTRIAAIRQRLTEQVAKAGMPEPTYSDTAIVSKALEVYAETFGGE